MKQINNYIFYIKTFINIITEDKIRIYAAQSSFFTIVGAFPFWILIFSQNNMGIINTITSIWALSRAFVAITEGLNSIYRIEDTRGYFILRIFSTIYSLFFIIFMICGLSLLVFGKQLINILIQEIPWFNSILGDILNSKRLLILVILTAFFCLLYKYIPNQGTKLLTCLPGALFTGLFWISFSYIYPMYTKTPFHSLQQESPLSTLVLAMLWLYICMYVLFIGAEINKFITNFNKYKRY